MTEPRCRMVIDAHGLAGRTPAVLAHERDRYDAASDDVMGVDPDVHIDPVDAPETAPAVSAAVLLEALAGPSSDRRTAAAAFVAGRCTTDDPAVDEKISEAVTALVSSIDTSEPLGPRAWTFVEAVMAQGLLGDVEGASRRFVDQLSHTEFRSVADGRAAGYLAQLGDPSGYPQLLRELHNETSAQVRMQALENLLAFVPYGGQQVGDDVVDVDGELRRAADDEPMVAAMSERLAASGLSG